jgi:hypothetical protein
MSNRPSKSVLRAVEQTSILADFQSNATGAGLLASLMFCRERPGRRRAAAFQKGPPENQICAKRICKKRPVYDGFVAIL